MVRPAAALEWLYSVHLFVCPILQRNLHSTVSRALNSTRLIGTYLSAMGQPTWQLGLPPLRGRQMSSNPCNHMDCVGEDHRPGLHMAVRLQAKSVGAGLDCGLDYTPTVCDA